MVAGAVAASLAVATGRECWPGSLRVANGRELTGAGSRRSRASTEPPVTARRMLVASGGRSTWLDARRLALGVLPRPPPSTLRRRGSAIR